MRSVTTFNDGWLFEGEPVSLPHNAVDLPYAYFDERSYQRPLVAPFVEIRVGQVHRVVRQGDWFALEQPAVVERRHGTHGRTLFHGTQQSLDELTLEEEEDDERRQGGKHSADE